ncbi:MAG: cell division protein FtsQ/DivIB [Terriglobia bacterium]
MSPENRPEFEELASEQPARYLRPQRKPEVRRRAVWRRLLYWVPRILLGATLAVALAGIGYKSYAYVCTGARFRLASVEAVELVNVRYAPAALLRACFAEDAGRSVFWVPLEARRRALEQIPWVAAARVQRFLPNRLRVVVAERTPVAFLRQGNELLLVDAEGVLLERPEGAKFTFPVLTGLEPGLPRQERRARLALYLEFLNDLDRGEEPYSADISEVDLSDPDNLRAIVTEKRQAVLLHFGRDRYREKYEAYRQHRALWQESGETVYSVDLRYRGQLILNPDAAPRPGGRSP